MSGHEAVLELSPRVIREGRTDRTRSLVCIPAIPDTRSG